ncbi:MerR family transcriptional regulator [Kutzneria buriramensis]|uniref:DNA-binding transcriptional MerR regulator n=1 Tax=Kutzneria buriramensis TaxID=1045776 RepID=A0A3E0HP80_9PSEU|nr:MerR family transcriptional regulator [Kutzneria buriramensis]REH48332.1 DNA-binding transcriptional MerR regulator [Kutzneria buriramensis]
MFSIGDFARLGLVSVRMLRHYDGIGLLPPAHVDGATGYRWYAADQLPRLNRIVALRKLGFTLNQVAEMLDDTVSAEQLRGMLRLRRAELAAQVAADSARLAQVEARLRSIEREGAMPSIDVVVKAVPAVRIAELAAVAASYEPEDIGPVIQPLYARVEAELAESGLTVCGPGVAYYEDVPEGVMVHAAVQVSGELAASSSLALVDLPAVAEAATAVHHGPMSECGAVYEAIAHWLSENGHQSGAYAREVYLHCPPGVDQQGWVTELQIPLR